MTTELVYANITCVMEDERRKQTEQKLIRFGKEEFLKKGYAKASLREICKAAGVTTGAFYFSFENKEALLSAILDPVIADYEHMCSELARREEEDPATAEDNDRQIMEYLSGHREEAIILMEKASGSRYEGSGSRLICRCRRHLRVTFRNSWGVPRMPNLSGFWLPCGFRAIWS